MSQTLDWEQHYLDDHTPWEKGEASPPLLEWLEHNPSKTDSTERVLVPGCGLGHDARALAAHWQSAEVVGLDISPTALQQAKRFDSVGSIDYQLDDLFALPYTFHQAFSLVWEHTCFCAIDPERRDDYVTAIHQTLEDRGTLLGVFFLDPYSDDHQPGGGPPHGASVDELEERFVASGKFSITEAYTPKVGYPGRLGVEYFMRLEKI